MAIAIAIKLLIFVLLITISSVIGIQVFENVSENSTKIIPTTTNHNNNNDSNHSSTDSNNSNDLNNRNNNISESGSINEQTTGTVSSSRYNNHKSHQQQRNHHRETTKNTFLTNIHNTMPIQYPKTTDEDHENDDSGERVNDPVDNEQNVNSKYHQISHNKKRQLFGKTTSKSADRLNSSKSDASNHNLTPSNSHHSTLNFVPSPQFDEFNEPSSYSSPNHQDQVQFKPASYDSYQNTPISHSESPRFAEFPKYPSVTDLNKDYPKFDELSKHYQQTQYQEARHNGRNFFYNQHHYHHTVTTQPPPPPPSQTITEIPVEYQTIHQTNGFNDDGQFIWIPNTVTPSSTSEQSPISHETKNGTGKWKWVSDDDNSGVEPKIMTPINPHPSYYEQIKIYHDIKTHPILQSDFPYSFDFKGGNGWDGSSIPGGNGKGAENGIGENITSLLSQWESMDSGKDEKEQNKTELETPTFDKGNFGLADILFPFMHKGKPADSVNKHIGNSSWKKVLHFLTAAIPIGLIISSLAPQVIYINANDTGLPPRPSFLPSVFKPAFQRSLDGNDELRDESRKMTNPLMDFLQILGENTRHGSVEQNTICEDRVFCEIAVLGAGKNADVLNKMLWKIANETPEPQARRSGLSEIFRVIRENRCHIYECERIRNSFNVSN